MRKIWPWIFAEPRRSRWFVIAVCFVFGLLAGWALGKMLLR